MVLSHSNWLGNVSMSIRNYARLNAQTNECGMLISFLILFLSGVSVFVGVDEETTGRYWLFFHLFCFTIFFG